MRSSARFRASLALWWLMPVGVVSAQSAVDQAIDAIRQLNSIGPNDQRQIKSWIENQVDQLAATTNAERLDGFNDKAFRKFRDAMQGQFEHKNNTAEFIKSLTEQTAVVATERFSKTDVPSSVLRGLARSLVDQDRFEAVPGLIAGLKVTDESTRYLCARGLSAQRIAIGQDATVFTQVSQALEAAGIQEPNGFIVGRIYEALHYPDQVSAVFPIYMKIFDARLKSRRSGANADIAETFAYEFFRSVASGLDNNQKTELVRRLAVFLRLDAERYNNPALQPPSNISAPDLGYTERDALERRLDGCEAILVIVVGSGKGGNIRGEFASNGYAGRAAVLQEAKKWYGDGTVTGVLNAAPWNVPVGAP